MRYMSLAESPVDGNLIPCLVPVLTEQCIRGYYLYYDILPKTPKTYLQAFYKANAGFIQSALSGLNLFYHCAHKGAMFIDDGSALQRCG